MRPLSRDLIEGDREYPVRILQFGGGNFLRAFTGWMVEILNSETGFSGDIAVVKPTPGGSYTLMKQQQGLYHVILRGMKDGQAVSETTRVHCVREIVNPYTEWEKYLSLAELESIRFIVSNTTEAGIRFDPEAEARGGVPAGFPAKLTLWLYHRYQFFQGDGERGCILLPCELIEDNGIQLYDCVQKHANSWGLEDGFTDWLKSANYFCNTLVDRIVTGFPAHAADEFNEQAGFCDNLLVTGEYYHNWVIEGPPLLPGEFPVGECNLNVQFVNDLKPYREMKVRILNAAHTTMVPVGYLMGFRAVHECMDDDGMALFLDSMLSKEICPTLSLPADAVTRFKEDTLMRFRNPYLNHRLTSIALNSMAKFKSRVIPVLLDYFRIFNRLPPCIVFSMAAQLCFYRGSIGGQEIPLNDTPETIAFFGETWKHYDNSPAGTEILVAAILSNAELWGTNLTTVPGLTARLAGLFYKIGRKGMSGAFNDFIESF